ncbi:DUF4352 domain-containing protein [Bacillus chungangensis]|uniref:DUF4352 domain-containing protein n=1 Tax=Bacillus chungangensis TaxID=587633 RepID=A0ABT9WRQ9_9BACI|nr:DUF4352 domain-containing protein [Bacillus chungangensis]MDQ0175986.1 hypothetical protein [Bacillus chungangensis]
MKKLTIIGLIFLLCFSLVGCGNAGEEASGVEKSNEKEKVKENATKKDEVETEEEESETVQETIIANVGEVFNYKDWEVKLDSFEFNQTVSSDMFESSADEGNKFLVLRFTVTNKGTKADSFTDTIGGTQIKAMYNEKYEYEKLTTLLTSDLSAQNVQPLATGNGFVVIEMPDNVVEASESIDVFIGEGKEIVKIKIR